MRLRRASSRTEATDPVAQQAAERLAAAVRIPTVTPPDGPLSDADAAVFADLHALLEESYPTVFGAAEAKRVGRAGLLLRLPGASAERPLVLMAHQDVVPAPEDWEAEGWEHPPFDGVIDGGRVHGRGTLDDKGALIVLLEAVESLLADGWTPARDVYLLFGADEETGHDCAHAAADLLADRGVTPWMVLDEGGAVATGAFPGMKRPMAVVGASEKGVLTVRLSAQGLGGHASTPPRQSAPGILARALVSIEENPHPTSMHDVTVELLETIAPHVPLPLRSVLSRARRLRGALTPMLARASAELAAAMRTTAAITRLEGSPADNVLATRASAVINLRVAVGSSCEEALTHLRGAIDDDRIAIDVLERYEPSPVSPTGDDERWRALEAAIAQSHPDAVAVPYIMLAATDGRQLSGVSEAVYRFAPLRMDAAQRAAIHGPGENVEIEALGGGVRFYQALLTGPALGPQR